MNFRDNSIRASRIHPTKATSFSALLITCVMLVITTALAEMPFILNIAPNAFDKASSKWSKVGPIYEGDKSISKNGGSFTHVYAKATGVTTYQFELPKQADQWNAYVTVTARLSSEFPYFKAPSDGYSDISLYLNGRWAGIKRVMPDDGKGQIYSWKFPTDLLYVGWRNKLQFSVSNNAEYKNGLCIYFESLIAGLDDAYITILFEPGIPQ